MSIRDLIRTAVEKDAEGFEAHFNDIMSDRQISAVETKYNNMFGVEDDSEPEIEIDEE
jgi:hypothetical protein|tara:strand:+ start:1046 stop:1219 length:174 start_codon:yes stop_codon:yes gene_type:complete